MNRSRAKVVQSAKKAKKAQPAKPRECNYSGCSLPATAANGYYCWKHARAD